MNPWHRIGLPQHLALHHPRPARHRRRQRPTTPTSWMDRWATIVDENRPTNGGSITMDDLAENPWGLTHQSRSAFTSADQQLQSLGLDTKTRQLFRTFLRYPTLFGHRTPRHRARILRASQTSLSRDVRALRPPFGTVTAVNALRPHPVHENDAEHTWMRSIFPSAGHMLAKQSPA